MFGEQTKQYRSKPSLDDEKESAALTLKECLKVGKPKSTGAQWLVLLTHVRSSLVLAQAGRKIFCCNRKMMVNQIGMLGKLGKVLKYRERGCQLS